MSNNMKVCRDGLRALDGSITGDITKTLEVTAMLIAVEDALRAESCLAEHLLQTLRDVYGSAHVLRLLFFIQSTTLSILATMCEEDVRLLLNRRLQFDKAAFESADADVLQVGRDML